MQLNKRTILKNELLKEEIHGEVIDGIKVFVLPKRGFKRKYAEISVHYGSNDNAFIPNGTGEPVEVLPGIAHFLEHKMFEKQWGEAFSAFAGIGASANAYTANNYTSYLFWTLENFAQALELLMEVVFSPHFADQSVEKEKGIITQEIRMYHDQPGSRLLKETLSSLFLKHPVRLDIAGTESSIKQVTKELLYLCHSNFYCGANTSLYMAGDFHPDEALDLAAGIISSRGLKPCRPPERIRPDEPEEVGGDVRVNMHVPTPLLQIGWKDINLKEGRDLILRETSVNLLLELMFGRSSSFFRKVQEEGLADRISFSYEAWPDYGFAIVGAETTCPDKLRGMVFDEIERVRSRGVEPKDFERLRRTLFGRFITLFDSYDTVGQVQMRLSDTGEDLFSYGSLLKQLDLDTVMSGLDCLDRERAVTTVIADSGKRSKDTSRLEQEQ
jgi:predicted Zn-dependent peptidase